MFQFRKMKSGVNLFECTVFWTLVCVSFGLNTTSSTGEQDEDIMSKELTCNLLVVCLILLVFIVTALCILYKKNSCSMLNISRDIHLRKVNMFEDTFLGITTRIKPQGVDPPPLYLGNRIHVDSFIGSNTTVKNKRPNQDDNMQCAAMKGSKPSGQILEARQADPSTEDELHVPIYPMQNKSPRGLAVIIGIDKFNNPESNLEAVAFDREMVKGTFNAIKFEVVECKGHNKQEIENFLLKISEKKDIAYDCFVCYISSHGMERHICCKDDDGKTSKGLLEIGFVISLFTNDICETFAEKPKVFFFDICLGERDRKYNSLPKGAGKIFKDEQERKAAYAHILVCYATIPDYVSWADSDGSRFTKALTYAIDKSHHEMSMDDIMYAINHKMDTTKEKNPQIPSYANELVKKLVLKENLWKTVRRKSPS